MRRVLKKAILLIGLVEKGCKKRMWLFEVNCLLDEEGTVKLGRSRWCILYLSGRGFVCVVGVPPLFGHLNCSSAIGIAMSILIHLRSP